MRQGFLFILSVLLCNVVLAKTQFTYPKSKEAIKQEKFNLDYINSAKAIEHLGQIKLEIIRGNLEKAKILLLQADYSNNFSKVIQYRYLAITQFLSEDYAKAIETLDKNQFSFNTNYEKVCSLKTLSYLMINKRTQAQREWKKCFKLTYFKSDTLNRWLDNFVVDNKFKEIKVKEEFKKLDIDSLKLLLKLALFLDKQKDVLKYVKYINYESITNDQIREIIAFMYYQEGKLIKANEFLKGIDTANIANIKGNLYLLQDKKEMAYAQFKLAYKKKQTSQNAIKRLVPLAWNFRQWSDGLQFTFHYKDKPKQLKILQAAFLNQQGEYKASNKLLNYELKYQTTQSPKALNLLLALNYIYLKNNNQAASFIQKACMQKDGLSCIYQYHFSQWENFSNFIQSNDKVQRSDTIDTYTSNVVTDPILEEKIILQRNLEELDRQDKNI